MPAHGAHRNRNPGDPDLQPWALPLGELAQRAGISARTLWLLRNGRLASIRISTLSGLAKILKVRPARLKSILDLPLR